MRWGWLVCSGRFDVKRRKQASAGFEQMSARDNAVVIRGERKMAEDPSSESAAIYLALSCKAFIRSPGWWC